jgi:hypothetical protein
MTYLKNPRQGGITFTNVLTAVLAMAAGLTGPKALTSDQIQRSAEKLTHRLQGGHRRVPRSWRAQASQARKKRMGWA